VVSLSGSTSGAFLGAGPVAVKALTTNGFGRVDGSGLGIVLANLHSRGLGVSFGGMLTFYPLFPPSAARLGRN
jgi:hypothetical protein